MFRILKVAHRGGAGLAPENTLAAFQAGLEQDADALELDVHLSSDGKLVVMHDPDLTRTTDGEGSISERTLTELQQLNAAAKYKGEVAKPQRVPTLGEVLELANGKASVQIEIKVNGDGDRYNGIEAKVLEEVRQRDMLGDVVILSFDFPTLQEIRRLAPKVDTCALISTSYLQKIGAGGPEAVAEEMASLGVQFVGIKKDWVNEKLLRALHEHDLKVGVWTVDEAKEIRKFADMGVEFITSNRPDRLREILGS